MQQESGSSVRREALTIHTGNLGRPILKSLLNAGFIVTALSRPGGNASALPSHPSLIVKVVDLTSSDSLQPALLEIDVVISCVATLAICIQKSLVDASVASEVKRFIPAEFGMDSANALFAQLPVREPKVATRRYLLQILETNPQFTFTCIPNGLFLDWGLQMGIILDLKRHTATLYNGGNVSFSATTLEDIASTVLARNRFVYVQSATLTRNQLIEFAKEIGGKAWETAIMTTEEIWRQGLVEMEKGPQADINAAMLGFCLCGSFTSDFNCDFSSHWENNLLGLKGLTEDEVRSLLAGLL
ncbi:oxidoreductase CipA-like protein [Colletotrichum acutatum]|uniref:Oxidoreductase CipA-like protein n=1 Tax=Glomerella acutata TaxID=27357 RepID=A0AAD8U610_GLOAC|nr:oxidoreductase CipA-like protein [Colletotrichum acutatum]KAK1707559.1 oxidoreductase CipA-like protein [Colletotrichum acutatum]